jgi:hypothetical protein
VAVTWDEEHDESPGDGECQNKRYQGRKDNIGHEGSSRIVSGYYQRVATIAPSLV